MTFSIKLVWGWAKSSDFIKCAKKTHLLPYQRLILLSDGSLTTHLESINGCLTVEIEHEPERMNVASLKSLSFHDVSGQHAAERMAWLNSKGRRAVFALSLIDIDLPSDNLVKKLTSDTEPLWRLLTPDFPFSRREDIEVGVVIASPVAESFSLPRETKLWARRYRLCMQSRRGEEGIRATIIEIFSPEIMGRRGVMPG